MEVQYKNRLKEMDTKIKSLRTKVFSFCCSISTGKHPHQTYLNRFICLIVKL